MSRIQIAWRWMAGTCAIAGFLAGRLWAAPAGGSYAVVVSKQSYADPGWKAVADALLAKHGGRLMVYEKAATEALPELQKLFPRYTCFVATPAEASRRFVAEVSRLTRRYDEDPYTDTVWGILTGFDAANALRIATQDRPLVVRKVVSGTDVALDCCEEGVWWCELVKNRMVRKEKEGKPQQLKGPDDTTKALVDALNEYRPDLFVTSGHATERDWQIGFRYRNGSFRSKGGTMMGVDTAGKTYAVDSPNPKVYLPIGNCLMGHIDSTDAMALAWMNSAGVCQMVGYTVPTWYGYAGWGCLDYFLEQPGRYTFAEAFLANEHALVQRLGTCFPELARLDTEPGQIYRGAVALGETAKLEKLTANDGRGLLHDRDVLAFYGDPAWEARMAEGGRAYEQTLACDAGVYALEVKPMRGDKSFEAVNTNGSQRGGRPIIAFLPQRIRGIQVIEGKELGAVVADDFVLVPNPGRCEASRVYRVRFRAEPMP